jgi:quinol monooxygenase YgiN
MAVTMFVRHNVNDFQSWKKVYDSIASLRQKMGVTGASVHRDTQEPNTVVIMHQFKDTQSAKAFGASEELKSAMTRAGVSGPPAFWFTEDVERTSF